MNDGNVVEILLVEDNPRDAELTIRAFRKNNLANNLIHVEDGAKALDFLFSRGEFKDREAGAQPKVILLDLKLPKVNGLEVLRIIKEDERTHTIPVVMITSSTEDPDIKAAYELGVNSYIVKPIQFEAFIQAMRQLSVYWLLVNQPLE